MRRVLTFVFRGIAVGFSLINIFFRDCMLTISPLRMDWTPKSLVGARILSIIGMSNSDVSQRGA